MNRRLILGGSVLLTTMDIDKFPRGHFALQYGAGVNNAQGCPIKWRKVMIKPF
jgi:hypothetical protein